MIIWNCQKVNSSNSALKPLLRLPNVPKVAYVWDILIIQAFGTSSSNGKYQWAYLWLETVEENWRKCTKTDPLRIPFHILTPQVYHRALPNTLRYLKWFPKFPRSGPDHSHALVRQLESQMVWIFIKFLQFLYKSKVTGAWNIKLSHTNATFGKLGGLGRGFSAE